MYSIVVELEKDEILLVEKEIIGNLGDEVVGQVEIVEALEAVEGER